MQKKRNIILAVVVIVLIGTWITYGKIKSTEENKPIIQTASVERGNVASTVSASGIVQPLTTIDLKSNAGGRVDVLAVDVGSVVHTGQLIAKIDPTDSITALNQAKADLTAAQAKVGQSKNSMILEAQQDAAKVRQAESDYQTAKVKLQQALEQSTAQPSLTHSSIAQAQASYNNANETLQQLLVAGVPQGTAQIRAAYNQAKASVEKNKKNYDRQKNLYDKGFISAGALDSAKLDYETAQADLDNASERMKTMDQDYAAQVRAARAKLQEAKAALQNAKANNIQIKLKKQDVTSARQSVMQTKAALDSAKANLRSISIKAGDITSSLAEVVRNKASVNNAQIQLGYTTVTAPRNGVVLTKYVEAGTIITSGKSSFAGTGAGTSIVQLGDLSKMFVLASVDETDIAQVRLGQRVRISVDALPDQRFMGKVTKIDPQTTTSQNVTTVGVTVQILNPAKIIKPGMNATCDFITQENRNVLTVPSEAVKDEKGRSFVTILRDGKQITQPVEVGIVGDMTTEIISGVKEGDRVVTRVIEKNPQTQANGMAGGQGGSRTGGGGPGGNGGSPRMPRSMRGF